MIPKDKNMNQIDPKRRQLIRLIKKYLCQNQIIIKRQLTDHKRSLEDGSKLKPKHLSQMVPLLVWDMKMNHQQVTDYFSCLVSGNPAQSTKEIQTLDEFLI
jgi:hypothetical protein